MKRPELVLAAAVAVCLPMFPGIAHGDIAPSTALVRFLVAVLVCWAAGAVLSAVLARYGEEARRAEIVRLIEQAQAAARQRNGGPTSGAPPTG